MLAKKKAAKKAAMKAAVEASRGSAGNSHKDTTASTASDSFGKLKRQAHTRPVLTRRDALEAGNGDGRSDLIKKIGDNVNTRLQEITFEDDLDADLFDERKRELLEEARLAAGTQQRVVSDQIARYVEASSAAAATDGLELFRIRHNSNAVTAVAYLGAPPEAIVFGDKSGKVYMTDLTATMHTQGLVHSAQSEARRHQKTLLHPAMNAAIVSVAISDTRQVRPNTRDLFEKTTIDTSCTSYTVAGAADGGISIWETATLTHKGLLSMHKKPITGLAFRDMTSTLYSVCQDGTLRVWSVPQMMAVDKLFGHEGPVYGVDALRREACASVGQDGTMRFWNVPAATQQAFAYLNTYHPHAVEAKHATTTANGNAAGNAAGNAEKPYQIALECVAMVSEQLVVAGAVDGSLILFDVNRRKPLSIVPAAHGYDYHGDGTGLESAALQLEAVAAHDEEHEKKQVGEGDTKAVAARGRVPNPITAVAAVPYSDVIASASYDGVVRLWRVSAADSFLGSAGGSGNGSSSSSSAAATDKKKRPTSGGANSSPIIHLLAEVPVHAIVTSLALDVSGAALIVGCSKEPRLGRWVVRRAALNSVCIYPLTAIARKTYSDLVGLSIEHVPALLYGFEQAEAGDDDDEEDEEAAETRDADSASRMSGDDVEGETGDMAGMSFLGANDDDDNDDALDSNSPLFVVGADGQLQFRPSALPTASTTTAVAEGLGGKKKKKKGNASKADSGALKTKKAKKVAASSPKAMKKRDATESSSTATSVKKAMKKKKLAKK